VPGGISGSLPCVSKLPDLQKNETASILKLLKFNVCFLCYLMHAGKYTARKQVEMINVVTFRQQLDIYIPVLKSAQILFFIT
jgi:hypothetical protein